MSNWMADDGTELYFELFGGQDGEKPVLLLLPGLLGSISTQWRNFIRPLSADYRLILLDLRGHGRSGNAADNLRPQRMVQDIIGLLDNLQINSAHIAGYSLGGYLGLLLAQSAPRRVRTLLMHATKFYWTPESAQSMSRQLDPEAMAEKVPTYADQLVQEHGARQWRDLVRQAADLVNFLVTNGLKERDVANLVTPLLVSVGERDELVPVAEAQRLSRVIEKAELIVLPGVRHPYATLREIPLLPMMQHFHK